MHFKWFEHAKAVVELWYRRIVRDCMVLVAVLLCGLLGKELRDEGPAAQKESLYWALRGMLE